MSTKEPKRIGRPPKAQRAADYQGIIYFPNKESYEAVMAAYEQAKASTGVNSFSAWASNVLLRYAQGKLIEAK